MTGPRLDAFAIKGYRSIDGWLKIRMPEGEPLVLIGENNAGKSNILRALNLLFGEFWPGSHKPEDHEFFGRTADGTEMKVFANVSGIECDKGCLDSMLKQIRWTYATDETPVCAYERSSSKCAHSWMSNDLRQALFCMAVGVNRDLSYQLSYGSKWTTLSKLMRRFHDRLVADPDRVDRLKAIFDSLVYTFEEVEEFGTFSDALRNAFADFGGNLRYGLGIDFSAYDPSNYFRSLRVFPHMDGVPRTYEELGTGQEQVLAMAFAYAYAEAFGGEGLILAIEEPESHLHPLAQQWLAVKLRGLAAKGVQVIVTTHSPYFVDLSKPWTIAVIRKQQDAEGTTATQHTAEDLATRLVEHGAPRDVTTPETVGHFYDGAATYQTISAFFARACVLAEGPTEELALPVLLRRAGLDTLSHGIAVVPVAGISSMAKWARLYRAYGIPVYAIFDSDTDKNDKDATDSLTSAEEVLRALGAEPGRKVTPGGFGITETYTCLDPNYEAALRSTFPAYADVEAEGANLVGKSKQLRARYAARNLPDPEALSENWLHIKKLVLTIGKLVGDPPSAIAVQPRPPARADGSVSRPAVRR
jgi:putative ATP-dependent endonuclease of the OLD family